MKITKLLPLTLALMLCAPASFSAVTQSETANAPFQVTMPTYIYIERTSADSGLTAAVDTIAKNYRSFTLDGAMTATFHVATNKKGDKVKLSAKCAKGTNQTLFADEGGANPRIVFTNNTYSVAQGVINSAGADGAAENNANAIMFEITANCANDGNADHGGSITNTAYATNAITYTLDNGEYDFTYTLPTTIDNNTFSTLDENGVYKTTLYLDHVAS